MACAGALLRPSRRGATSGHKNGRIGYKTERYLSDVRAVRPQTFQVRRCSPVSSSSESFSSGDFLTLEELGTLARKGRKAAGHSQEEAAARLGVRQLTVSNAENADESNKKTLFRLVDRYTDFEVRGDPRYQIE
jgi:ribosome-binding protein aMBF1 (putative translation factor)